MVVLRRTPCCDSSRVQRTSSVLAELGCYLFHITASVIAAGTVQYRYIGFDLKVEWPYQWATISGRIMRYTLYDVRTVCHHKQTHIKGIE